MPSRRPPHDDKARLRARRDTERVQVRPLPDAVFHNMSEGLVVYDATGAICFANDAALDILGLDHRKLIGRVAGDPRWALVREDGSPLPPEDIPSRITARTGRSCRNVILGLHVSDGSRRWLSVSSACVAGDGDPSQGVVVIFTDITASRAAGLALEESSARLLDVTTSFPGAIYQLFESEDGSRRFLFLAGPVEELLGASAAAIQANAQEAWARVHPDDLTELWVAMDRAREHLVALDVVLRIQDGRHSASVRVCARPWRLPDGTRWTGVMLDVTRQIEQEMRMRAIFDAAVDAILTISSDGVIEQVNPAVERVFGYSTRELVGQNIAILMPSPDAELHDRYLERYKATGRRAIIGIGREVVGRRRDGTTFPAELAVSEFLVGGERRFTGVIRDVSERKRIDRQVSEYELRLRASLAYDLHDSVSQLLAGGRFLAQNLASDLPEKFEPRMSRIVSLLTEALEKVRGLSNSLSALDMAGTSFTRAIQVLAKKTSARYAIACHVEVRPGTADPPPSQGNQAYMVVEEALANAARHSGCTTITIGFEFVMGRYVLGIRDDGRGISNDPSSAGLGLTTMRHRARLLGGFITVSRVQPTGTEVHLDWPVAEESRSERDRS